MKLYEYIDKAIYNYASCYDAPNTDNNEEFSDALVDVIDLIKREHNLLNVKVGILGMAFKANIDDTRDSLSFKLKLDFSLILIV